VADDVLTLKALRRRRAEILGIAQKRRVHRIAVFGSVARGQARPDSDLDLLVDFEPGASLLITSACSKIWENCWASESTSSRGAPSSHRMTAFAPRPLSCYQTSR
jgi:predicted nucleotidyltransferase